MRLLSIFIIIQFYCINNIVSQQISKKLLKNGYSVESFSGQDLQEWETIGKGQKATNHEQLVFSEVKNSAGYMIISPGTYNENVVMTFDVMPLNPATVLVVELCASNKSDGQIEFPDDYNGNVKYLFENVDMYMFAFHNAAHNKPGPFIRKYPEPGTEPLVKAKNKALSTGFFHHVEIGKEKNKIWLSVDGKKIVDVIDPYDLKSGKLIFRIRGTAHELASCIIRNMKIYSK